MIYKLYGAPGSLHTAKARSYLIKQGISFENRAAGEAHFRDEIVSAVGRWIIPVVESPDGSLIQDGSDIIQHFETAGPSRYPASPQTPRHRLISQIFELFGAEGLLRPAMHYRWNFDEENRTFLEQDFASALAPIGSSDLVRAQVFESASSRMRKAMAALGVVADSIPAVEASYREFLSLLNAHLANSPYLLGGRPTLGDYALTAPLYAHLARDPKPAGLMKATAHRVWRWTERMNAPGLDSGEYGAPTPELFADDAVPASLLTLLRFVAEDYLPEIQAHVTFTNDWLSERPEIETGSSGLPRTQDRHIGFVPLIWRGVEIKVAVMPYRLYLLQKIQAVLDAAHARDRALMDGLLADAGLSDLATLRTSRPVIRRNQLEVWGDRNWEPSA